LDAVVAAFVDSQQSWVEGTESWIRDVADIWGPAFRDSEFVGTLVDSLASPKGAVQTSNQASAASRVAVDTAGTASHRSRRTASHAVAPRPAAIAISSPIQASGQCRALTLGGRVFARYAAHGIRTMAETATRLTSHRNAGAAYPSGALPCGMRRCLVGAA
jgi:hypothetical protein